MVVKVNVNRLPKPILPPVKRKDEKEKTVSSLYDPVIAREGERRRQEKRRQQSSWNDEQNSVLIELVHQGMTHTQIAEEMGRSRGSVSKQILRLRGRGEDV